MNVEIKTQNEQQESNTQQQQQQIETKISFSFKRNIKGITYTFECEAEYRPPKEIFVIAKIKEINDKEVAYYCKDCGALHFVGILKLNGVKFKTVELEEELKQKINEWFYKQLEIYRKKEEERIRKENEEYEKFLQEDNYFKDYVKIFQFCDSGEFRILGIDNEKIRDFVNEALNKYLYGVIFDGWYPDYYLPPASGIFYVKDLINEGKAKIIIEEGRAYLLLSPEIVNTMIKILKEEKKRIEEEKRREKEERKRRILEDLRTKGVALINRFVDRVWHGLEIEETYAFASKEKAEEFIKKCDAKYKSNIRYDEEFKAYTVTIIYREVED